MCIGIVFVTGHLCRRLREKNAYYVDSGGVRSVLSTNKIDVSDWNAASTSLVNDLLSSGAIDKTNLSQPIKIKVGRITNRTSNSIDTDMLTKQVCMALNTSGKIEAESEDALTKEIALYEAKMSDRTLSVPKLTITGKITEDREANSDLKEVTYVFFLEVNYRGKSIWMGQKQITKQSEQSSFTF